MRTSENNENDQEPMGIVISGGSRAPATPRLWAYVWGQFEEPAPASGQATEVRAA
ncbi:MAG: hypothetical protein IT361_00405 [Gemmatimonadaceae bacterium]|nr:hypothetical protein [Gemmatimonadaceae bacterium]